MLTRWLIAMAMAMVLPAFVAARPAHAADSSGCPPGTTPVTAGGGVICVTVTDPGSPGQPSAPGGGSQTQAGCYRSDGTKVSCRTSDGYWWSAYQCYAAPSDAPPGTPPWRGHTDGSVWDCTSCDTASSATCTVQVIWVAPGDDPGPPTPAQLAATAIGLVRLAKADVHIAPQPPAPAYVGVENWLWIPRVQWATLSRSVTAGPTTVRVTAAPSRVAWDVGPATVTCAGPGEVWARGMSDAATTDCGYTYTTDSSSQRGGAFAISAVIEYHVTWTCSGTCSTAGGDLGLVDGPAGVGRLRVLQRQTVVVR